MLDLSFKRFGDGEIYRQEIRPSLEIWTYLIILYMYLHIQDGVKVSTYIGYNIPKYIEYARNSILELEVLYSSEVPQF